MPSVNAGSSSASRPRKKTAIANAAHCASLSVPSPMPLAMKRSSSGVSVWPSRLSRSSSLAGRTLTPTSSTKRRRTRCSFSAATAAFSSVCSWLSVSVPRPSARFVIAETAATRRPQWRATITSGTVDIPTASAPSILNARISAGVSNDGPETAR